MCSAKDKTKIDSIPLWDNPIRQEAIERFFSYSDEYLANFICASEEPIINKNDIQRNIEHFLMFLTTAVQNISDAAQSKTNGEKLLNVPSYNNNHTDIRMRPVLWTWEARNTLAHRFIEIHKWSNTFDLYADGFELEVNGVFLAEVVNDKNKSIEPPEIPAVTALKYALEFWKFTYQYILKAEQRTCRITYNDLLNEFESQYERS